MIHHRTREAFILVIVSLLLIFHRSVITRRKMKSLSNEINPLKNTQLYNMYLRLCSVDLNKHTQA